MDCYSWSSFFWLSKLDEVDASGFGRGRGGWLCRGQLAVDDRIDQVRRSFELSLKPDLDLRGVERIEANLDRVAGQMRRSFIETVVQRESRIAPYEAIEAMEEEAAQIRGGRKLAHLFDVALPAHEWCGSESAVFGAVIGAFDPGPEPFVQLVQRKQGFGIEVGKELLAQCPETALDFSTALGLIRSRMDDERAERGRDARQLG
jgi:hypothetical protein